MQRLTLGSADRAGSGEQEQPPPPPPHHSGATAGPGTSKPVAEQSQALSGGGGGGDAGLSETQARPGSTLRPGSCGGGGGAGAAEPPSAHGRPRCGRGAAAGTGAAARGAREEEGFSGSPELPPLSAPPPPLPRATHPQGHHLPHSELLGTASLVAPHSQSPVGLAPGHRGCHRLRRTGGAPPAPVSAFSAVLSVHCRGRCGRGTRLFWGAHPGGAAPGGDLGAAETQPLLLRHLLMTALQPRAPANDSCLARDAAEEQNGSAMDQESA
ncbi:hypothetical protein NN561_009739 [Cricetulus griseus]